MRYWITMLAYCLVIVAASGCATKAHLEFTDYDGTTFKATSKAGPFGELDTTNQRLGYVWLGDGSGEINVGQDAQGLSNAGQIEALKSVNQTAAELVPAVLQLGAIPSGTDDPGFGRWLDLVRVLAGGDGAVLSALLQLFGI